MQSLKLNETKQWTGHFINDYKLLKKIAEGTTCKVYLAKLTQNFQKWQKIAKTTKQNTKLEKNAKNDQKTSKNPKFSQKLCKKFQKWTKSRKNKNFDEKHNKNSNKNYDEILNENSDKKMAKKISKMAKTEKDVKNNKDFKNQQIKGKVALKIINKSVLSKAFIFTEAVDKNGEFAIKKTTKLKKIYEEAKIHSELDHVNILKFYQFLENGEKIAFVLEYSKSGPLMIWNEENGTFEASKAGQKIFESYKKCDRKLFTENGAKLIVCQLIEGILYLEKNRICHRDIKPSNLLLINGTIKICDFGISKKFENSKKPFKMKGSDGTPNFIAPECITEDFYCPFKAEVWSVGILIHALIFGTTPFYSKDIEKVFKRIVEEEFSFPAEPEISDELKSLFDAIFQKKPDLRCNLCDIKSHPWCN